MKGTFKEFETEVQQLCRPEDFNANNEKLKGLRISSYEPFTYLLKSGGDILPSLRVVDEIFKLSTETHLTEINLVNMMVRFNYFNGLLNNNK